MCYKSTTIHKVKCYKCGDTFIPTYGNISFRTSCRVHNINKHGHCLDCNTDTKKYGRNCHHVNISYNWW